MIDGPAKFDQVTNNARLWLNSDRGVELHRLIWPRQRSKRLGAEFRPFIHRGFRPLHPKGIVITRSALSIKGRSPSCVMGSPTFEAQVQEILCQLRRRWIDTQRVDRKSRVDRGLHSRLNTGRRQGIDSQNSIANPEELVPLVGAPYLRRRVRNTCHSHKRQVRSAAEYASF